MGQNKKQTMEPPDTKNSGKKFNLQVLQSETEASNFQSRIETKLRREKDLNWTVLANALRDTATEICPPKPAHLKPWIDDECRKLIEERRKVKKTAFQSERYHELCRKVSKACRRSGKRAAQKCNSRGVSTGQGSRREEKD